MILSKNTPQETSKDAMIHEVSRFLSGDQKAFRSIKKELEPIVQSLARKRRHYLCTSLLEDITQELWIELCPKLSQWDPKRGSLKAFAYWSLKNRLSTCVQQEQRFAKRHCLYETFEQVSWDSDDENPSRTSQELDVFIQSRFHDPVSQYILQSVALALYFNDFDKEKPKIIKRFSQIFDVTQRKILFFIEYSVILIKRYSLETKCLFDFQNTSSIN